MGKKDHEEMERQRTRFIDGCLENRHPREEADQIFNLMYQFAGYGFPKGHAAAYALLTHQTAYLKAHYPGEFIAATMTAEGRDHDKLRRYIGDAAGRGIRILAPSVNESDADFTVIPDGTGIRFGLYGIKNVGEGAAQSILEARGEGGAFVSLFEFCARVDLRRVNRRVVESLVRCGALDFAGPSRAALWESVPRALERAQQSLRDREAGQELLFSGEQAVAEPTVPDISEWPDSERLEGEKEALGFYVTGHPLRAHEDILRRFATLRADRIPESVGVRGQAVRAGGILSGLTTTRTRRGSLMARALLEDLGGALPVVFFPDVFDRHAELLRESRPLLVEGTFESDSERPDLLAKDVLPLEEAYERRTKALHIRVRGEDATEDQLERGRKALDLAPGETPVFLRVRLGSGAEASLALPRHRVTVTGGLVHDLEAIFGKESVECQV
jgi:DNA polymerase-3 subunit alpha